MASAHPSPELMVEPEAPGAVSSQLVDPMPIATQADPEDQDDIMDDEEGEEEED